MWLWLLIQHWLVLATVTKLHICQHLRYKELDKADLMHFILHIHPVLDLVHIKTMFQMSSSVPLHCPWSEEVCWQLSYQTIFLSVLTMKGWIKEIIQYFYLFSFLFRKSGSTSSHHGSAPSSGSSGITRSTGTCHFCGRSFMKNKQLMNHVCPMRPTGK